MFGRDQPPSPVLETIVEADAVRIRLGRCLVLENSLALHETLMAQLRQSPPTAKLTLDLSAAERIDTAGVAAILDCFVQARRAKVEVVLEGVGPPAVRMFELFHLGPLLHTDKGVSGPV